VHDSCGLSLQWLRDDLDGRLEEAIDFEVFPESSGALYLELDQSE
jgi:hypothetical protein